MSEISKLKARMKNVAKETTEYRMTVTEAKTLLNEIAKLEAIIAAPKEVVIVKETVTITEPKIWDGGSL